MTAVEHPSWCVGPPDCPVGVAEQNGGVHRGRERQVKRGGLVVASASYRQEHGKPAEIVPRCGSGLTAEEAIEHAEHLRALALDLAILS